ncbi:hypothetical protein X751_16600 [Mesorhizobium sp. LNJC395A00]|nr:hypothetical protein X751_16600 [Mesorhizobium sp. LNJC395A00]
MAELISTNIHTSQHLPKVQHFTLYFSPTTKV